MKSDRLLLVLTGVFLLLIVGVSFLLWHFQESIRIQKIERRLDGAMEIVMERVEDEKRLTLSMVHFLAQDKRLHEMVKHEQREKAFALLQEYLKSVGSLLRHPVEVQIHTKELHTFLRSWDFQAYDIPLASFRKGLVQVKESGKPHVSIELGKRLNIKAIAPMMEAGEFVGSVEVIVGFEALQKQLRNHGITLAVLLHSDYLDVATDLKDHHRMSGYVIANNDCERHCLETLQRAFGGGVVQEGAYLMARYALGVTPLFDSRGEKLGFWGVVISKEGADRTPKWSSHQEWQWQQATHREAQEVKIR